MGAGIAEVCARAGKDVVVIEETTEQVVAGTERIEASLNRAAQRGKIENAGAVFERVQVVRDLDALEDRDLVIEAIVEDGAAKSALFAAIDRVVKSPEAILASNTSSIPIMRLAVATERPAQVIGLHFFNPVPVLNLVEVVPSLLTDGAVTARVDAFARQELDKHAIRSQDRAGFVVNALLIPFVLSAIRMLESGFATADDIDEGLVRGAAHPQGPLALADLIGLDTVKAIAESLYEEFKEPLLSPPPMLTRMVQAGLLGRKAGRGFYTYGQ
jgi:3-hydroxybutyryl-CoA dehydrogenase